MKIVRIFERLLYLFLVVLCNFLSTLKCDPCFQVFLLSLYHTCVVQPPCLPPSLPSLPPSLPFMELIFGCLSLYKPLPEASENEQMVQAMPVCICTYCTAMYITTYIILHVQAIEKSAVVNLVDIADSVHWEWNLITLALNSVPFNNLLNSVVTMEWLIQKPSNEDTLIHRTHLPVPTPLFVYITTPEIRTPH